MMNASSAPIGALQPRKRPTAPPPASLAVAPIMKL